MRLVALFSLIYCLPIIGWAQVNLVPNPSFEQSEGCPTGYSQFWRVHDWTKVGGDGNILFFHQCGSASASVPVNASGNQLAFNGSAYISICLYHPNYAFSFHSEPNFIGVELIDSLIQGRKYRVSIQLSLIDNAWIAARDIGLLFSDSPLPDSIATILNSSPQVLFNGPFLDDKLNWMEVSGEFIAQGGERFLTIGNFNGNDSSDTLHVPGGAEPPTGASLAYWDYAQYYVDMVTLYEVDTTVGLGEKEELEFEIFPNPFADFFNIEWQGHSPANLQLTDATGRVVLSLPLHGNKQRIDASGLPQGVYLAQVVQNGIPLGRQKLFKQ